MTIIPKNAIAILPERFMRLFETEAIKRQISVHGGKYAKLPEFVFFWRTSEYCLYSAQWSVGWHIDSWCSLEGHSERFDFFRYTLEDDFVTVTEYLHFEFVPIIEKERIHRALDHFSCMERKVSEYSGEPLEHWQNSLWPKETTKAPPPPKTDFEGANRLFGVREVYNITYQNPNVKTDGTEYEPAYAKTGRGANWYDSDFEDYEYVFHEKRYRFYWETSFDELHRKNPTQNWYDAIPWFSLLPIMVEVGNPKNHYFVNPVHRYDNAWFGGSITVSDSLEENHPD